MKAVVVSPRMFGIKTVAEQKQGRKGVSSPEQMAVSLFADTHHRTTPGLSWYYRCMHKCMAHTPGMWVWPLARVSQTTVVFYSLENTDNTWNCQMISCVAQFQTPWQGFWKQSAFYSTSCSEHSSHLTVMEASLWLCEELGLGDLP